MNFYKIRRYRFKRKSVGFTLVELVVVVSIIAIISGISIFAVNSARTSGRDAKRKGDLAQIASGLEMYKSDCNYYPRSLPSVGSSLTGNSSFGCTVAAASSNIYIQALPGDPGGSNYGYTVYPSGCLNNCTRFCLWAKLEDSSTTLPSYCNASFCGSVPAGFNYCLTSP